MEAYFLTGNENYRAYSEAVSYTHLIAVFILFLKFTGISYEIYNEGGHLIEFWLKPAVVALGLSLIHI